MAKTQYYTVFVRHYDEGKKKVSLAHATIGDVEKHLAQQQQILAGYYSRVGRMSDGSLVVFGDDDIFLTTFWFVPETGGKAHE